MRQLIQDLCLKVVFGSKLQASASGKLQSSVGSKLNISGRSKQH